MGIQRTEIDFKYLMKMVRYCGWKGHDYLDQYEVNNVVDVPKGHYFIFDVENDDSTFGISPEKAEAIIKKQKRSPLTVDESIALCIHTNVLSEKNCLYCTGSRCKFANEVPCIDLDYDRPNLGWRYAGVSAGGWWGSSSCRSRV